MNFVLAKQCFRELGRKSYLLLNTRPDYNFYYNIVINSIL